MTTAEFMKQLLDQGIHVSGDEGKLRVNAPKGVLTQELKAELSARKPEVLAFLLLAQQTSQATALVSLTRGGTLPNLYAVPGHNGDVFCYVRLAEHLGNQQPFHALRPPGLDDPARALDSIEAIAQHHVEQMLAHNPTGPYQLLGYCLGGVIAFETAHQLSRAGHRVSWLGLLGTPCPTALRPRQLRSHRLKRGLARVQHHWDESRGSGAGVVGKLRYLSSTVQRVRQQQLADSRSRQQMSDGTRRVADLTIEAVKRYRPEVYPGRMCYVLSSEAYRASDDLPMDWRDFAERFDVLVGPDECDGDVMLQDPFVGSVAGLLSTDLERSRATAARNVG